MRTRTGEEVGGGLGDAELRLEVLGQKDAEAADDADLAAAADHEHHVDRVA